MIGLISIMVFTTSQQHKGVKNKKTHLSNVEQNVKELARSQSQSHSIVA
jgi:hypothetical protein